MKFATNKKRVKIVIFVAFAILPAWIFRPYPTITESKVHPLFRGLDKSSHCEWTHYGDGGSLAIRIPRADGSYIYSSVSNSIDQASIDRGQIYVGSMDYTEASAIKVIGYDHTRFLIANMLAHDIAEHSYVRKDIAVITGRTSDWIRYWISLLTSAMIPRANQ